MHKYLFSLLVLLVCNFSHADSKASLQITMTPIYSMEGHIMLALYKNHKQSSWPETPTYTAKIPASLVKNGQIAYQFEHLEPGMYAIRLYHDLNDNQQLDLDSNHLPLEPFAFSAAEDFLVPNFEQALFTLNRGEQQISLSLRHPQTKLSQDAL